MPTPTAPNFRPTWLDVQEYPFAPRSLEVPDGTMHYVDEGDGPVIVLVHGTPTWSYLYRHQIKALSSRYRVIAPDHLGFGLSEKPESARYSPSDHAANLRRLLGHLGIGEYGLVVHDFGGPIGLAVALEDPEAVRALALFNTWMWSISDDPTVKRIDGMLTMLGGSVGRFLYKRLNISPRVLLKSVFGDKTALTKPVHSHYTSAFPEYADRQGPLGMALALSGEGEWYDSLWARRDTLRQTPALLLWGMKDPTFTPAALERWLGVFAQPEVERFPEAGHFLQEERSDAVSERLLRFFDDHLSATR